MSVKYRAFQVSFRSICTSSFELLAFSKMYVRTLKLENIESISIYEI